MARRKSYRGTSDQHRQDAGVFTGLMRSELRKFDQALRGGKCAAAMAHLAQAHFEAGRKNDALRYTVPVKAAVAKRKEARIEQSGTVTKLLNAKRRFAQKCL